MKSSSISSSTIWKASLLMCSLTALGCAQGGSASATGNCALAIGGPATITVSPELRAALGDSAIEAASRGLGTYLGNVTGPIGPAETRQATSAAVDAGERAKGTPLTLAEKQALEDRTQVAIREYKARCDK
jgi:hypothetical protein